MLNQNNENNNNSIIKADSTSSSLSVLFCNTGYLIQDDYVCYINNKDNAIPISNCFFLCREKYIYNNANCINVYYKLECYIIQNNEIILQKDTLLIDAEQYSKFNFLIGSVWDKYAIIKPGRLNNERMREITQLLSRHFMTEKNIYSNIGFERIDDKLCYLYHGGAIGDLNNIEVDLSSDNLQRYCFTDKSINVKQCLNRSLSLLDITDRNITIPLTAVTYLSPLVSTLAEEDILADFVLYLEGKSGAGKSTLASIFLSYFGKFDRDNFPSSFRDTVNSIEKKAYLLKDCLNVIDDFNPSRNTNQKLEVLEKIYAMYGDRTGRTRMSKNGENLKKAYYARGLAIITGETIPDLAQSRIARSMNINIKSNSIDSKVLNDIMSNKEELAMCMKTYIRWIIDNEEYIRRRVHEILNKCNEHFKFDAHGRTLEIAKTLMIGYVLYTEFLQYNQIIDCNDMDKMQAEAIEVFKNIIEMQKMDIEELKPTAMFYNAVEQMIAAKQINLISYHTGRNSESYNSNLKNVGFIDNEKGYYYFYADIIYTEVSKFYALADQKFPISAKSLWKYMLEENCLYRTDEKRYTIQRRINDTTYSLIAIKIRDNSNSKVESVKWHLQPDGRLATF